MTKLYDVAAHEPGAGELLFMYRGVPHDKLEGYCKLLAGEWPGAEITERDYEPEDDDSMDIPEYLKRDPTV